MFSLHLFQSISGKSQKIGDFTFCWPSQILPIYQISARSLSQDSPNYEFGGIWKVRQELKLEHKCNSITATWMHTSLCCVVLNTSVFLNSWMQFSFLKNRSQLNEERRGFGSENIWKKERNMVSSTCCFPSCTYLCLHLDSSKSSNSEIFRQPLFFMFRSLKSAQALL